MKTSFRKTGRSRGQYPRAPAKKAQPGGRTIALAREPTKPIVTRPTRGKGTVNREKKRVRRVKKRKSPNSARETEKPTLPTKATAKRKTKRT